MQNDTTMTAPRRRELIELWLLANDGAASDLQLAQLSRQIAEEPEARAVVLQMTGQQGWLAWNAANVRPSAAMAALSGSLGNGTAGANPQSDGSGDRWRPRPNGLAQAARRGWEMLTGRGHYGWVLALVAVCGIGFLSGRGWDDDAPDIAIEQSNAAAPIHATMVSSTGCVWGPGVSTTPLHAGLYGGGDSLQLLEGIAEFDIRVGQTDVRLQLEGPASAVLTGQGTPSLSYGKVVVKFTGGASGRYPIETAFGRVLVEHDADVGVIAFGSRAEIHCFRGRATIESPWLRSNDPRLASVSIEAGEAVEFADVGGATIEARRVAANKERFTPQVSMATDFLSVSPEYVREVVNARPLAYWRFEDLRGHVARNEMGDALACQVKGDVGQSGPQGNRALQLGFTNAPGSLVVAGPWDKVLAGPFSIEAWIKPNHYHSGSIVGFVGEFDRRLQRNKHGVLLETCGPAIPSDWVRPKQLRFLHRSELTADSRDGVSCFSGRPYDVRRWQHVAAVKDGSEIRLYVDGELLDTDYDESATPQGLHLVIGQLYTETVERFFIGQLDEVAIYDRALSDNELREHYELLRPSAPKRESAAEAERAFDIEGI